MSRRSREEAAAYDPLIEKVAKECDAAAKLSQEAWERGDEKAAHAADRQYCESVRLYHAYILRKSIDLGLTELRPEDRELLALLKP